MSTELSMHGHTNQVCSAIRDKEEIRVSERRRHILYLIWHYLGENGYTDTQHILAEEAQLSSSIEVCDNVNLEIILAEYENYYRMRFNKYPMLCKKVVKAANITENKAKHKSVTKVDKKEKMVHRQPVNSDSACDLNSAVTVTSIGTLENKSCNAAEKSFDLQRNRQSEIAKTIENLYSQNVELKRIAEDISMEIVFYNLNIHWDDVIGLTECKTAIKQAIVYPLKYPIFFAGKFSPWRGILLYGAPGTGKTLLAKAVATECKCTFFNITASSLVSKWRGDSEKYIRVLFDLAYSQSPTIIFIDEIDWITTKVQGNELSEPARRFRSELLARMDGLVSSENSNVVVLAATNAPWNIDAALLRRLEKRIHVSLPDTSTILNMFSLYVSPDIINNETSKNYILNCTKSYSGADIKLVCKEAWMRQVTPMWMHLEENKISVTDVKYMVTNVDILCSILQHSKSTVKDEKDYVKWSQSSF